MTLNTYRLPDWQDYTTVPASLDDAVNSQIAYDDGADIDDTTDDEK